MLLEDAKHQLVQGKGSLRCHEVKTILDELGFTLKAGKKQGHYVYKHPRIEGFMGDSFCCPHRKGDPVGKNYITGILRVLRNFDDEFQVFLRDD